MRIKCLAQEHNTMTRPGLEPGPLNPDPSELTTKLSCPPASCRQKTLNILHMNSVNLSVLFFELSSGSESFASEASFGFRKCSFLGEQSLSWLGMYVC